MTLETDMDCLRRVPLFKALPGPRLKLVALMGERLRFAPGAKMMSEGEQPEGVLVILAGEVEIVHEHADPRSKRFSLTTGSIIGDVPILAGQNHVGEFNAKTDVTVLRLPKDLFFELLETIPDFSIALARDLAARLYRLADAVLHEEKVH